MSHKLIACLILMAFFLVTAIVFIVRAAYWKGRRDEYSYAIQAILKKEKAERDLSAVKKETPK